MLCLGSFRVEKQNAWYENGCFLNMFCILLLGQNSYKKYKERSIDIDIIYRYNTNEAFGPWKKVRTSNFVFLLTEMSDQITIYTLQDYIAYILDFLYILATGPAQGNDGF